MCTYSHRLPSCHPRLPLGQIFQTETGLFLFPCFCRLAPTVDKSSSSLLRGSSRVCRLALLRCCYLCDVRLCTCKELGSMQHSVHEPLLEHRSSAESLTGSGLHAACSPHVSKVNAPNWHDGLYRRFVRSGRLITSSNSQSRASNKARWYFYWRCAQAYNFNL